MDSILALWGQEDDTCDMKASKFDAERKAAYILAYERTGEVISAAAAVRVCRQTVYRHLNEDPEFAAAIHEAEGRLVETIVQKLKQLAIEGVETKHYDKEGKLARVTRTYSERLMLAWLKRLRMRDWGDKLAVDQTVTGTVTHQSIEPKDVPRVARNRLREALEALPDEN